jgi:hypothetical protein
MLELGCTARSCRAASPAAWYPAPGIANFSLGQCIGLMGGAFAVAIAVYFVFNVYFENARMPPPLVSGCRA